LKPWFFFTLLLSKCLNWKIYCDDHSSLSLVHQSISTLKEKPKSSISNRTKRSALFLVTNIPVHNILKGPFEYLSIPVYTSTRENSTILSISGLVKDPYQAESPCILYLGGYPSGGDGYLSWIHSYFDRMKTKTHKKLG